jgi:predicted acyltransferase
MNDTPTFSRITSVDAYRGFVMLLMMGEVLSFGKVSQAFPDSGFWQFLTFHQSHVEWIGCSLHDLIQPSFSFLVGVALPYSIASRMAKGDSKKRLLLHAFWRSLVLILLGFFLRSMGAKQTNFTFEDTLTQIGLGYFFLFLLGFTSTKTQIITLFLVLLGYFAAFALYPLPTENFNYTEGGVAKDWVHNLTGFGAHWNKNTNLAWAFDRWFLNLFPRESPFLANGGGYATLSFIPTLGTMILGLLAGNMLKNDSSSSTKIKQFLIVTVLLLTSGWLLNAFNICPAVKRIWTPSWTLYSGGWCFLLLTFFYFTIDVFNTSKWAFILVVIGANSIAAYVMAHTIEGFIDGSLATHFGKNYAGIMGANYAPLMRGGFILLVEWLILFWLYRKRVFIKV